MISATPKKLDNGEWGARVQGTAQVGDTVVITTKAGKTWEAVVTSVVSKDGSETVVTTKGTASTSARSGSRSRFKSRRGTRTGCRCGSVEEYSKDSDCWQCRHDA